MVIHANLANSFPCVGIKTEVRSPLICVCCDKRFHVSDPHVPQMMLPVVNPPFIVPRKTWGMMPLARIGTGIGHFQRIIACNVVCQSKKKMMLTTELKNEQLELFQKVVCIV